MAEPALTEPTSPAEGDTVAQMGAGQEPGRLEKLGGALIDRFGPSPGEAPDAGVIKPAENYEATRLAQGGPTHIVEEELSANATDRADMISEELDRIEAQAESGHSPRPEGAITVSRTEESTEEPAATNVPAEAPSTPGGGIVDVAHLKRNLPTSAGISKPQVMDVNPRPVVNPPLQMRPRNF